MIGKIAIISMLLGAIFFYGFSVGYYRIFPFPQLMILKHHMEQSIGTGLTQRSSAGSGSTVVQETFLQKLLIKKVPIQGLGGRGGGISVSNDRLYIVSSTGSVISYDLAKHTVVEGDISSAPLNLNELIQSGHPFRNDFKIYWFRVNGVYSESIDSETHILFVSHNSYDSERDCITQNISRAELKISDNSVVQQGNWQTIFTASPCIEPVPEKILAVAPYPGHISGGVMINFDAQKLLVAIGDYNRHGIDGTDEWAMDTSNPYGKLILVDKTSGDWSVFTTGNRNPSGLYKDKESVIWSVELGPEGGDELNILVDGENYGWPKVSYGLWYEPAFELPGNQRAGTHPIYRKPVFSWVPSISPRGLTKIEGTKFEHWEGDLIMGTMSDKSLHRLRLDENNRVVYNEKIEIDHRVRDVLTLPDDRIALVTDDGYLMIIEDGGPSYREMDVESMQRVVSLDSFDRLVVEFDDSETKIHKDPLRLIFERHCSTCHNLNPNNQIGPHLSHLMNRRIGAVDGFRFSQALRNDTRNWDAELLMSYLKNPFDDFPGTTMPKVNLTLDEISGLIKFFENQVLINN